MLTNLPLSKQPSTILAAIYRHIAVKVDDKGNVSKSAIQLLCILQSRGYDVKKLIRESP